MDQDRRLLEARACRHPRRSITVVRSATNQCMAGQFGDHPG
jgi:hypothetical protein